MNPRTCIVTRQEQEPDQMIRFVLDPENRVVPDLKRKLPGRGVWVSCERSCVEQTIAKGLFAKGFKSKVSTDHHLADQIDRLMTQEALNAIALAKKAGVLVPGQAKAEAALRSGESELLITATDAGADGVSKMGFALRSIELHEGVTIPVFRLFLSDDLDRVTGGTNVMHLAIAAGGMANKIKALLERLVRYRQDEGSELEKAQ